MFKKETLSVRNKESKSRHLYAANIAFIIGNKKLN